MVFCGRKGFCIGKMYWENKQLAWLLGFDGMTRTLKHRGCNVSESLEFRPVKDFWQAIFMFWLGVFGRVGLRWNCRNDCRWIG